MRRRAADLDEPTHRFLQVASVWGKRFAVDIVAEAAGVDQPARLVERAQSHGFIEPVDPRQTRQTFRFSHSLFREVFRGAVVEQGEVERFHQRLAEAADRLGGSSLFDVAYHYANGDLSAPARTLELGLKAGRRMVEERAFDDALVFLRAAGRAAEMTGQATGGELPFLLGEARIQAGEVEEGRALLEEAIDRADDDLSRARYQVQINEVDISRLNLRRLERGARRALGWLGEGLERAGSRVAAELARFVWWRSVADPQAARGAERERQRLLTYIYEHLSMVATFQERPGLGILAQLGGITSAMRLGDSPESITGHTSYAVVMALAGRHGEVDWGLDRARQMARRLDSPLADMRIESPASWCQHIAGEPVEAAERLDEELQSRADQMPIRERSLSFNELCWNYGMRGYSRKVLKLYERWRAINRESREVGREPISAIYAPAMVHARLCGRDELADRLRRASRRSFERGQSPYLERVHRSAVVLDEASSGASFERVDEVIEARRRMGVNPSRSVFWSRDFFIYQVYARYYQWRAGGGGVGERLEQYDESVDELAEAADGHPTLRAHMLRNRAEVAAANGQMAEAARDLGEAERLAALHDNDWAACGVAHARANWYQRVGPADENRDARRAAELAERMGWRPYVQTLREEFNLGGDSSKEASIQESLRSRSVRSLREMRLERQLEALMDVSLSTESLLEPERVARRALEAAIRVLGAERGFLFLPDGDGSLRRAIGRSTDAEEIAEAERCSRSVVDRVADSREPEVVTGASIGGQVGRRTEDEEAIRSVLAAPLVREEQCIGVIYLDNRLARGVFSPEDVDVLRAIANHVTVALETARSAQLEVEVASERKQRTYAEKLREFTERINASIDIDDILAHLVEQLDRTSRFDRATGVSLQGERPEVRVLRADGQTDRGPFKREESGRLLQEGSPLDGVLTEGGSERGGVIGDGAEERPGGLDASTAAYLAVPLISRGQTFGALLLERREADPFVDSEVERIKMYASQVGVALEKAMLATVDPLTSLYNRRKFFELAERGFARAVRYRRRLSVMMLDIDDFKEFNDTHGHAAGDRVLEQIAVRCRETLRETDIIGRYGGEEFVILLPSTPRRKAAKEAGERLCRQIASQPVEHDGASLRVTVSIGVAGRRQSDADIHEVIERADRHLYAAKKAGKNRVLAEAAV